MGEHGLVLLRKDVFIGPVVAPWSRRSVFGVLSSAGVEVWRVDILRAHQRDDIGEHE